MFISARVCEAAEHFEVGPAGEVHPLQLAATCFWSLNESIVIMDQGGHLLTRSQVAEFKHALLPHLCSGVSFD